MILRITNRQTRGLTEESAILAELARVRNASWNRENRRFTRSFNQHKKHSAYTAIWKEQAK